MRNDPYPLPYSLADPLSLPKEESRGPKGTLPFHIAGEERHCREGFQFMVHNRN